MESKDPDLDNEGGDLNTNLNKINHDQKSAEKELTSGDAIVDLKSLVMGQGTSPTPKGGTKVQPFDLNSIEEDIEQAGIMSDLKNLGPTKGLLDGIS